VRDSERGKTISAAQIKRDMKREKARLELEQDTEGQRYLALVEKVRPRTWGECKEKGWGNTRPCPFIGCRYHLYADIQPTGALKLLWPTADPLELPETCTLVVAEAGERTLDEVGQILNITRERVRQVQVKGSRNFARRLEKLGLSLEEIRDTLKRR